MKLTGDLGKIERLAKNGLGEIQYNYSGRNMYGKTCVGIVTTNPIDCVAKSGVLGAHIDNMGLSYIVYWPKVGSPNKEEKP